MLRGTPRRDVRTANTTLSHLTKTYCHVSDQQAAVNCLNKLLKTCYDGEKGYKEAADDADDSRLKSWFREYAQQRYDFGHEIKSELRAIGGEPDKGTTIAGDVHRVWIDLKTALTGNDDEAVLNEAIRGEEHAIERYDECLNDGSLPATARTVISRQRSQIQAALGKLHTLKSTFAGTAA